jgi:hypothetical protein
MIPVDERAELWSQLEKKIQDGAGQKDISFRLEGSWKEFLREQEGFRVYLVDGKWVYNNLSVMFSHGGHGLVHEFIPHDEIWISKSHHNCSCKNVYPEKPASSKYIESTILHEIFEYKEMKKGPSYWIAHNMALDKEREAGLTSDPYSDENESA